MQQLESSMLSQNKNKSYLVSVEKAVKQSKGVADCGTAALLNIEKIVKFLKIEKLHSLVFETEVPKKLVKYDETSFQQMKQKLKETEEDKDDENKTLPPSENASPTQIRNFVSNQSQYEDSPSEEDLIYQTF